MSSHERAHRAQVTLFVIIGVLIISIIVGFVSLRSEILPEDYDPFVRELKDNLLDCFESEHVHLTQATFFQGGYLDSSSLLTERYYAYDSYILPYYYDSGEPYLPRLIDYEAELSRGGTARVVTCITMHDAADDSFTLSFSETPVVATIHPESIAFSHEFTLTLIRENTSVMLDFASDDIYLDSRLVAMHEIAALVVDQAVRSSEEWIGITELHRAAQERNVTISILDITEDPQSYVFVVEDTRPDLYPARLVFAMRYNLLPLSFPTSGSEGA